MAPSGDARRCHSAPAPRARPGRDAASVEDACVAVLVRTYQVVWQVEMDMEWSMWLDYPADQSRRVEAAWQAMAARVEVGSTAWADGWLLDFRHMVQTGDSGRRRRIRRVLITNA